MFTLTEFSQLLTTQLSYVVEFLLQRGGGGGGGGGTIDFEVWRHFSEESGITQQLYIRGGLKRTFSERSLYFLCKNTNLMSAGSVDLILSAPMPQSCRDTPVFT